MTTYAKAKLDITKISKCRVAAHLNIQHYLEVCITNPYFLSRAPGIAAVGTTFNVLSYDAVGLI